MARREHQLVKAGFTLVELLVYIAIVGIVVIVAGQAFSNSTKMRVRTQSMLKASEVAENVAMLFRADVAQTGAKSSMESAGAGVGGDNFSAVNVNVYMNAEDGDSSSFSVSNDNTFSDFTMRRIRYDGNGHYVAVEEVNWFVDSDVLKRSCRTIAGTADAEDCAGGTAAAARKRAVEVASGVTTFKVIPAMPGVSAGAQAQLFPPCTGGSCTEEFRLEARTGEENFMGLTMTPAADNKSVVLSNFVTNYKMDANDENKNGRLVNQVYVTENVNAVGSWKNKCYKFTFEPKQEYELSFTLTDAGAVDEKMHLFVPGRDYMSVGFRLAENGSQLADLEDFMFFPPADEDATGKRSMRFNVPRRVQNVCIAFSFASYSPLAAKGNLNISEVKLKKVESANYKFEGSAAMTVADKQNVKAVQLVLGLKRNGEEGRDSLVVRIPSNGPRD